MGEVGALAVRGFARAKESDLDAAASVVDSGFVVPLPREPDVDPLTVPLTELEPAVFQRLVSAEWRRD